MIRFCESFGLVGSGITDTDQYVLAKWSNWQPDGHFGGDTPPVNPSGYLIPGTGPIGQTCFVKQTTSTFAFDQGGLAKTVNVLPGETSCVVGGYFRPHTNEGGLSGIISVKATVPNYEFEDRENPASPVIPAPGFSTAACDLKMASDYSLTLTLSGSRLFLFLFNEWGVITGTPIAAGAIAPNEWQFIELKLDWSTGAITGSVHIDEVQVLGPSTTTDTTNGEILQWTTPLQLSIGFYGIDFTGVYALDNLPSHDGSIAATDFLGPVIVNAMPPIADGSRRDWTPDTGTDHFARVAPPQDGDLSYVATATAGFVDTYKFQPTVVHEGKQAFPAQTIYGVAVNSFARKADDELRQIAATCISGASVATAPESVGLTTQYTADLGVFEVNPANGQPWNNTTLDTAEFGTKLAS
jgi:hypothetical protein